MAMRSTDKDLLVAQRILGRIRHPDMDDSDLLDLVDKGRDNLSVRFVDMSDYMKREVIPEHKVSHTYDLTANFRLRCQTKAGKYVLEASIKARGVTGVAKNHKECLGQAKEKFRLHVRNSIRDKAHPLYNKFLEMVKVQVVAEADKDPEKDVDHAKEIFRKFIGVQLGDEDSQLRHQFFNRVKSVEVRAMQVCEQCHKEKPKTDFFTAKEDLKVCAACRGPDQEEVDEDMEESDAEVEETESN